MQSNRKVAFNSLSFSSFFFLSMQSLELKSQVKQSCADGGDITWPQALFHTLCFTRCKNLVCASLGVSADFILCTEVGARGAASKGL